jgi:N-acetyl-anhydromuramyl-L-alanine amidase AmpD
VTPFVEVDGLRFAGLRKLSAPPPFLVGHWSGGEGDAGRIFRVLNTRRLSAHFAGDLDGRIVKMAEPDERCAHAGSVGNAGLGIEFTSRGLPRDDGTAERPIDIVRIRGAKVRAVRFTEAQTRAWVALAEWFAATFGAPRVVPEELRTYSPAEIRRFRGALEHLHISPRKVDSGGHLVGALVSAGWKRVRPTDTDWKPAE